MTLSLEIGGEGEGELTITGTLKEDLLPWRSSRRAEQQRSTAEVTGGVSWATLSCLVVGQIIRNDRGRPT